VLVLYRCKVFTTAAMSFFSEMEARIVFMLKLHVYDEFNLACQNTGNYVDEYIYAACYLSDTKRPKRIVTKWYNKQ